ncbi:MAG: L,D-transpeptidase [Methylovirgula sp.]
MIWQRMCLAIGLAVSGAMWSQVAVAQASDAAAAAAQTDDAGTAPAKRIDHSAPASQGNGGPKVIVDVDLSSQRMHVQFPDGSDETWPIASGRPGLDTPDGNYKPQWVDPDHVSKEYDNAPMPYAIFFDLKGHAIHGSYQKRFGKAVSHGCVRLPVADAKKLFEAVKVSGAEIEITGRASHRGGGTVWASGQPQQGYPPQEQYGDGYDRQGYGYQRSPYPAYQRQPAYPPPPQSFFGALFGN